MTEAKEYPQSRFRRPAGACEILLVRHGESAPAREDAPFELVDGQGDPPLAPRGREQAELVGARLAASGEDIAAVYVTTMRRTHETAAPLLARLGMQARVEPDLREVHLGEWEGGLFRKKIAEGDPIALRLFTEQRWDVIPGAEAGDAFAARVRAGITRVAGSHPDQTVVVVSHGGVIGQVLSTASGARGFAFNGTDNAGISHVVVTGDQWTVRRYNDTSHLGPRFTEAPEPLT